MVKSSLLVGAAVLALHPAPAHAWAKKKSATEGRAPAPLAVASPLPSIAPSLPVKPPEPLMTEARMKKDPLAAIDHLLAHRDSDEKFEWLHLAEVEVAQRTNAKAFAHTFHLHLDAKPGPFENYVVKNQGHFSPPDALSEYVRSTGFWLERVKNRQSTVLLDYEFDRISNADEAAWIDGDGSARSPALIKKYEEWLRRGAKRPQAPQARERIDALKSFKADPSLNP